MHQIRLLHPAGGAYSALPHPLAGFKGATSKGRGGKGRDRREGTEGKGSGHLQILSGSSPMAGSYIQPKYQQLAVYQRYADHLHCVTDGMQQQLCGLLCTCMSSVHLSRRGGKSD